VGQVRKALPAPEPAKEYLPQLPGGTKEIPDKSALSSAKPTASAPLPFFGSVEQMPVFKGGADALMKFIAVNFHRPTEAPEMLEGRVFIRFMITETGAVRDVQIAKGLHPALDAEAVRVVKLLDGKFTPGQQNSRPIAIGYTLPFTFESAAATQPAARKRQ
jgi:TonB family protein